MIRTCSACGKRNRIPPARLADRGRCGACKASFSAVSNPIDVDLAGFDAIISNAKVPVLVDFWAPWCGPCRMAAPIVSKVASSRAGKAVVLKVNTDTNPELAARYNISGIPNFIVFKDGVAVRQKAGLAREGEMAGWLD